MTTIIISVLSVLLVGISLLKSPGKTKESLQFSVKMFKGMASQIIWILALISLFLSVIPQEWITKVLGSSSSFFSTLWGALLGTITIIPGVIAFPLAKELYVSGALLTAIAAFITTLTMVGFATMPVEIGHFGKKFTLIRNGLSLIFAIAVALVMGVFL